ncbi:MAG: hypothetical protein ACODAQ_04340 [Phycisphaeraceae bacterium]
MTQSATAGFPDRPRDTPGMGLLVSMTNGNDGAYLEHDLGASRALLHVRFALNPASAKNGSVRLAGASDAQHEPVWWIDYECDLRAVTVAFADGTTLSATLSALAWHVIELRIDTGAEEAVLWINGVVAGATTGAFNPLAARYTWIGAFFKDTALSGELFLDEWCLADQEIGPVTVAPNGVHGDDPARWLVIYNTADADAATWAAAYRAARGVPYANLLGLDLPLTEVIDESQFEQMVAAIEDYLDRTGLDAQIMGLLAGYRVPGYVDYQVGNSLEPVPALLHLLKSTRGGSSNVNADNALPTRPTQADLGEHFLAARLDAPDLNRALALVQRATALIEAGLTDADHAAIWFGPFNSDGDALLSYKQRMIDWAQSVDRMRTRLPFILSGDPDQPAENAAFSAVDHDGFLWCWDADNTAGPPAGYFADPAGLRVASVQVHPFAPTAPTIRSASPTNWIEVPLDAGYAAAVASSDIYAHTALPYARPFFDALRRGWTLAEAWYLAVPILRDGLYLVGDPLLRVTFPHRGWDVYGPLDRLESLDPAAPTYALRDHEHELVLPHGLRPAAGSTALYLVRHIDAKDRPELSLPLAHLAHQNGAAHPPMRPVWPDHPSWPVPVDDGKLALTLMWERPLSACRVAGVELRGEVDGAAETTLAAPTFTLHDHLIRAVVALPTIEARYRWRITSPDDVVVETDWSQRIGPRSATDESLHLLEVQP